MTLEHSLSNPQRKLLYVYDPRAMHSVVVKDQYNYEQPDWFIKCVFCSL